MLRIAESSSGFIYFVSVTGITGERNELPPQLLDQAGGPYKLLSEAGRSADWDVVYENIEVPVLVVTGLQDHVFREPDAIDHLFSRLPKGRKIDFADAGHLIPAERPEKLADTILTFAEGL